jgi:deazaflavin-dependent oxidoreductase (nitroreductase family)
MGTTTELQKVARRRVVRLTTRGRKSGRPRTVTIWFVLAGPSSIYVQHASRSRSHWYENLVREPNVSVDFGNGPLPARATPIRDAGDIQRVLRLVRRKYPLAWVFQLLGWGRQAVAAEIVLGG